MVELRPINIQTKPVISYCLYYKGSNSVFILRPKRRGGGVGEEVKVWGVGEGVTGGHLVITNLGTRWYISNR